MRARGESNGTSRGGGSGLGGSAGGAGGGSTGGAIIGRGGNTGTGGTAGGAPPGSGGTASPGGGSGDPGPDAQPIDASADRAPVDVAGGDGAGGDVPPNRAALRDAFATKFKIGMAVDPNLLSQPVTRAVLTGHANSLTAESVMKPNAIGVGPGVYDFTVADTLIDFARSNGIAVRGHTLVWHRSAPAWFFEGDATDPGYKTLVRARLEKYITDVVTHFKGKVYCWDVVNEAASTDTTTMYRNSPWYVALGPDYIDIAFRAARAADPDVKLFINDFDTEYAGKRRRLLGIVKEALDRGVPIDGVGHQLHASIGGPTPAEVNQMLLDVEALKLANHITELEVSIYADPASCHAATHTGCLPELAEATVDMTTALRAQALQFRAYYNVFAGHPSVTSVTTWGVADDHTVLDRSPVVRKDRPFMFDVKGQPKPAFRAAVDPAFVP